VILQDTTDNRATRSRDEFIYAFICYLKIDEKIVLNIFELQCTARSLNKEILIDIVKGGSNGC